MRGCAGYCSGQMSPPICDSFVSIGTLAGHRGSRPRYVPPHHEDLMAATRCRRAPLLAENRFRGADDAHGRILPAIGAELLGVLDEDVGVDDRFVGIALVPAVHPG